MTTRLQTNAAHNCEQTHLDRVAKTCVLDLGNPKGHLALRRAKEHLRHLRSSQAVFVHAEKKCALPPHRLAASPPDRRLTTVDCKWRASSAVAKEVRSSAVSRVWRRDETKMRTGFVGECERIAAKVGLFIAFIRGQ